MLAGTGVSPCDRVEERDPRSDGSITTTYDELDYGARLGERAFARIQLPSVFAISSTTPMLSLPIHKYHSPPTPEEMVNTPSLHSLVESEKAVTSKDTALDNALPLPRHSRSLLGRQPGHLHHLYPVRVARF